MIPGCSEICSGMFRIPPDVSGFFPGCQIVAIKSGNVFYNKSFGYHTYNKKRKVKWNDIYDIASRLLNKKIEFHFVGNDCYLCNCGIEQSKLGLPNCKVWGERSDMDSFYSSMDLFLFPSLRELNPLSVKEAGPFSVNGVYRLAMRR